MLPRGRFLASERFAVSPQSENPHCSSKGTVVSDPIHPVVLATFGTRRARPRVVRGYTVQTGWVDIDKGPVLTAGIMTGLRRAGYSMIEARWRRQTRELSLLHVR